MAAKGGLLAGAVIVLAGAAAGGWYFGSPIWTLDQMRTAVEARDAEALSRHVDFDALRADLRSDVSERIEARFGTSGLLADAGGLALAMVDPIVDQMISPEGMQTLMGLAQAGEAGAAAGGVTITGTASPADTSTPRWEITHRGRDSFKVTPEGHADQFALVFTREGLGWKLAGVELAGDTEHSRKEASL